MREYQERTFLAVLGFSSPFLTLCELQAGCWSGLGSYSWLVDPCAVARRAALGSGALGSAGSLPAQTCLCLHTPAAREGPQGSVVLTPRERAQT